MSDSVAFTDADNLRLFMAEHPKTTAGVVIYRGQEVRRLDEKIVALPLAMIVGAEE
ncbi:MAG: hypothetical protein HZC38_13760 [Chloroflexi bacterium]|nr:hypothetical protein [Chloroflexota bacterium]MBI5714469.1 hypothetical protein [Chloroflexota bacterium]